MAMDELKRDIAVSRQVTLDGLEPLAPSCLEDERDVGVAGSVGPLVFSKRPGRQPSAFFDITFREVIERRYHREQDISPFES
ncbi:MULTISPECIES: hypothetical protein [Sorangium]|uniref:hypothetical protein n=1 Tax=Sorangium TaxID=39643 RepID=UPI003D9C1BC6